jgi:hypothetical protein
MNVRSALLAMTVIWTLVLAPTLVMAAEAKTLLQQFQANQAARVVTGAGAGQGAAGKIATTYAKGGLFGLETVQLIAVAAALAIAIAAVTGAEALANVTTTSTSTTTATSTAVMTAGGGFEDTWYEIQIPL